jgi:hypothetical protein
MDTTAVILAGGENVRLQVMGLPPGKKPLMVHNGEVLIRRLCRQVEMLGIERLVIVASPSNCEDIVFATREFDPLIIVQYTGDVHHAMDLAMSVVQTERVLLLMGDNYVHEVPLVENTPYVSVVRAGDGSPLHRLSGGLHWLGPVLFNTACYGHGAKNWDDAIFRKDQFVFVTSTSRDMGAPHEWQ